MIENRELGIDDYLAMLRRRVMVIVIPALIAPIIGFAVSYGFAPKFTSQATILVEDQKVPDKYVKSVVTEDIVQRIANMQQQVLSHNQLQPMVERLGLAKKGKSVDDIIDEIRLQPGHRRRWSQTSPRKKKPGQKGSDFPGLLCEFHGGQSARRAADLR